MFYHFLPQTKNALLKEIFACWSSKLEEKPKTFAVSWLFLRNWELSSSILTQTDQYILDFPHYFLTEHTLGFHSSVNSQMSKDLDFALIKFMIHLNKRVIYFLYSLLLKMILPSVQNNTIINIQCIQQGKGGLTFHSNSFYKMAYDLKLLNYHVLPIDIKMYQLKQD